MARSIILHEHFTATSMKQVQHMLLQYCLFKFCHSFFVYSAGSKTSLRPTHFTRKRSPNHDQFRVFNSWNFEPGIKSIRWWWGSNDGGTHL